MKRVTFLLIIFLTVATNVSALSIHSTWDGGPGKGAMTVESWDEPSGNGYNYNYFVTNGFSLWEIIEFKAGPFAFSTSIPTGGNSLFIKSSEYSPTVGQWNAKLTFGGISRFTDYRNAVVPSPSAPEPSTILLLGSGLVGAIGFGRKRLLGKT